MSERLNLVTVTYTRGTVALPRASCDALLAEMPRLDSAASARRRFEALGASARVRLETDEVQTVLDVVEVWMRDVGRDGLPEGVFELRNALLDDLNDSASS